MWPRLQRGRRRHAIPDDIWAAARHRIRYAATLPAADAGRLRTLAERFIAAKTFEGAAGLQITDGMRAHVALQACLLILNLDLDFYAGWHGIILYPGDFRVAKEYVDEAGVVHHWTEELAGEAWEEGPVILSWDATATDDPRMNIVLHEFAHKLDMRDGVANGCPPLPLAISPQHWQRDFSTAYERFCEQIDAGEPVRVDDYAAESPAEFFAVLSEMFFLQPDVIQQDFPAVYEQLRRFYRQDPLAALTSA